MWHIYWNTSPINACNVIWPCGIFVAFEGHTYYWHILCSSMVNKYDTYTVIWALYVDYSRSAVKHMCNVAGIFLQGHIPVM